VGEVGDALAVAKMTDGILLVVRQDYCNRQALNATIHQFEFMGTRILGTVFNCTHEEGAGYGRKYYSKYGQKYYRYYRSYYGSHQKNEKEKAKKQG
jgi:receptor protein-tyrosine kinase